MELQRHELTAEEKSLAQVMAKILFPNVEVEGILRDLGEAVWLEATEDAPMGAGGGNAPGIRDPLWRDRPHDGNPNLIVLGYYDHEHRTVVLRNRTIQRAEDQDGLAAKFGAGVLFRVVLAHEMAHWFTWMSPPKTKTGTVNNEVSEALAELLSWATFSKEREAGNRDAAAELNCQYWLNEDAPVYWYRVYWLWLVLVGFEHAPDEPGRLMGNTRIAELLLAHSQADGNLGFFSSWEEVLRVQSGLPLREDEHDMMTWNPWDRALSGYPEAFARLLKERAEAVSSATKVPAEFRRLVDF